VDFSGYSSRTVFQWVFKDAPLEASEGAAEQGWPLYSSSVTESQLSPEVRILPTGLALLGYYPRTAEITILSAGAYNERPEAPRIG
jgi:hypothetical protein